MFPETRQSALFLEISHHINSPLAAIRNALYLAGRRSDDPEIQRYLRLADQEVTAIVAAIAHLRSAADRAPAGDQPVSRRAAA